MDNQCPNCSVKTPSYFKLLNHLQLYHEYESKFSVTCGIDGCPRQYSKIKSLKDHIRLKHKIFASTHIDQYDKREDAEDVIDEIMEVDDNTSDKAPDLSHQLQELKISFQRQLTLFSLKIQEKHFIPKVVQREVTDDVKNLLTNFHEEYKGLVRIGCEEAGISTQEGNLQSLLGPSNLDEYFQGVDSEYQFERNLTGLLGLIEPIEFILGHSEQGRKETFQYVPILDILKLILSKGDIWSHIINRKSTQKDILRDYCDGTILKGHPFFSTDPTNLKIHLYSDELEVVNPLGSKRGVHKVASFYFIIGNLHPKYRAQLKQIHLCLLVRFKHVQKYGYNAILKPLLKDLEKLQVQGIQINVNGTSFNVKGSVSVISADNLTSHALAGFSGSFSNGRICRYCMCHYDDISEKLTEDKFILRTPTNHQHHLECIMQDATSSSLYGVTGTCPFSILPNFEVTNSFPPDVMHDFLEGTVPHVMKLLIRYWHKEGVVTIQQINAALIAFPYGQNDLKDKPVPISLRVLNDGNISGKAVEKWTLLRMLPFLVGEYVSEDDTYWEIFLLLREIADIILAPAIQVSLLSYLNHIITTFIYEFNAKFPKKIIPKMHFLLHYPRLIQEYGPLRSLWCMRFEAKHQFFKKIAGVINNFINICYSLARRHQMHQCWEWQGSNELGADLVHSSVTDVEFVKFPSRLKRCFAAKLLFEEGTVWKTNEVTIDTVKYRRGDFIIVDVVHGEEIPQFLKIVHIVKLHSQWWICGKLYNTKQFSRHYHSYIVTDTEAWLVIKPGDELDFQSLDCYKLNEDLHITLRHRPVASVDDTL